MNRKKVKALVVQNKVVAIKADKSPDNPTAADVDRLLAELGNPTGGIPYYAIYPAAGGKPKILEGLISERDVIEALQAAGPSNMSAAATTAMHP